MKALLMGATILALLGSSEPLAQGAPGLGGFGWGAPRVAVTEQLVGSKCRWRMTMTTLQGHKRIVCPDYDMKGLGPVYLTIEFIDDAFRGYSIAVPRHLAPKLKAIAAEILSASAASHGAWKTRVEILEATCQPSSVCLDVTAY